MAALQYLKEGKAAGPDKIFTDLLLHANEELEKSIHKIFNHSSKTGTLPEDWRTADVKFLRKSGKSSYHSASAYRPISLTSCCETENTEKYMSPFCRMLIQLEDIKADKGIDTFNIEQDFSFQEGLYPTLTKPEYWSHLGSSKNRTNDQKDESRNLINDILEACTPDTLIAFTDGSCHPNPGPCRAGACVYLPFETSPVNLKQPVSKHGSILFGEMIAIKMVLDFILEKLHQKRKLNKVLILSDSQSSVGLLTLGW